MEVRGSLHASPDPHIPPPTGGTPHYIMARSVDGAHRRSQVFGEVEIVCVCVCKFDRASSLIRANKKAN